MSLGRGTTWGEGVLCVYSVCVFSLLCMNLFTT